MRLGKRGLTRSLPSLSGLLGGLESVFADVLAVGREMARIPAGLYMRAAEAAGAATLAAWLFVWPLLVRAWALARAGLRVAEREVTPPRAALAVGVLTAVALAGSQFADYRTVAIDSPAYSDVAGVAGAPEVGSERAGAAHAWVGLPLAAAALVALGAAGLGVRRAAWALAPIGLATVAVSLLVDAPKGLDEGAAAIAYEGASASLIGGFWVQLSCGVLLAALAPLLAALLRPSGSPRRARRRGALVPAEPGEAAG